ncbi:lipid II flippase MurJ [Georgenia sp. 10Sc9-8]|uniref:Lipid II flippase MurJ n=1 Tax=Georgenia halotolerans TaxID=3028317 RepID=A0ABT5TYJ4_9MICO|nr:lipid II flippase MurJ [Georgenia halotolerans]
MSTTPPSPLRQAMTGVVGAAGMIAVVTLLSRVVGFARWLVHSWTLEGGSATAGAYAVANQIPNVMFEVAAGGALAGVVVPLLAAPLAKHLRQEVDRTSSALLTWTLLALVPLGATVAVLAGPVAALVPDAAGSDVAAQRSLITYFLRVFALQIPLYGVGVVLTGVLQAQRKFFWPAVAPLLSSLVVIASYVVFGHLAQGRQDDPAALDSLALGWLAWGTTAGVAAMSLPLLVPVLRSGVRLRPRLHFPPGVARRARNLAAAGLGGLLAQQVAVMSAVLLAPAGGRAGTLSIFQYAQAVYFLPYAVLAVPVATAVFPRLAERAGTADRAGFAALAAGSTRLVLAVSLLGTAVLVAVAPAATAVFSLRAPLDGMTTAITLMAPGVAGYALIFHVSRTLYTLDRGRTAVLATATGWGVVALASVVGVRLAAPEGGDEPATLAALALATTTGMVVAGIGLLMGLRRVAGPGALAGTVRTVSTAGGAAVLGAGLGRFASTAVLDLAGDGLLPATMAAALGAIVSAGLVIVAVLLLDRSTVEVRHWSTERPRRP